MIKELKDNYGHIFEKVLLQEINQIGILKEVPEGFKLIEIGNYIRSMPLLLSGALKVLREDNDGGELLLYFLENGDTCAITLTCCIGHTQSEIRVIAETDTKLMMIPFERLEGWILKYPSWRNFVLESYHNGLNEMLETLDGIAFLNMHERLIKYLKEKVRITNCVNIQNTHQEIAYDLHTSRVVVSRLLKKLEDIGKIQLHRNQIKVADL